VADITTYVEQLSARVNIPDIFVGKRRRKDYGNIEELAKDFRDNGQITAITLRPPNEEDKSDPEYKGQPWALVAGGRRLAAATQLNWTSIRAVDRENMDELKHRVLELAENLARKEMTFVEVVQAKQEMFLLRKEQNPEITQAEVAKEIGETAANFSRDLRVAEVIEQRPELKQASSKKAVIRQAVMAEHFEARLLRDEVTGNNYMIQLAQRLVTAEAEDWLKTLPEQFADLCIPDLPYGIDHFKQGHKTDAGEGGLSEFDDSEGVTLDLFVDIVPKMMRATKQSGWIICFISEANYEFLKDLFQGCCRKHYEYHGQHEETDECDYGLVEEPRWIWYRPNSNNNPRFPEIHAKNVYENILVFNRGNGKLRQPHPCNTEAAGTPQGSHFSCHPTG
jgi:ParB/RepB/Spo0J family partition protein